MDKKECIRIWVAESGEGWECHPKSCVFCDNCSDIWYDSNGPYMISCNKGLPEEIGIKGQCKYFTEENPIFVDKDTYIKQRNKTQKIVSDFYEKNKDAIDTIIKESLDDYFSKLCDPKDLPGDRFEFILSDQQKGGLT